MCTLVLWTYKYNMTKDTLYINPIASSQVKAENWAV